MEMLHKLRLELTIFNTKTILYLTELIDKQKAYM